MKPALILSGLLFVLITSCGHYVTPGDSVKISELADEDISKLLSNKPSSEFPVNIAIARIQHPQYASNNQQRNSYSEQQGNYSLILTRNSEEEAAFEKLSGLNGVKEASPFNRLLLPYNYKSIKDLRLAAAKMKAQMLMVYTFDTEFTIDTKNYGPQNVVSLGYLKNKDVKVSTTASVALFDVQTEYLYGLAEATTHEDKKANAWKKGDEVDNLRIVTEKKAFEKLMGEIEKMWTGVFQEYGNAAAK